jgi:uncharacterized protein GlcG (DUF336 family)
MRYVKHSHGVEFPDSQRRQSRATQRTVLQMKMAIICLAGGVTIYYSESAIVGVVASTVAGCTVEMIDAQCEKRHEDKLKAIEKEIDKLRKG